MKRISSYFAILAAVGSLFLTACTDTTETNTETPEVTPTEEVEPAAEPAE